jgi:hypothetical protein
MFIYIYIYLYVQKTLYMNIKTKLNMNMYIVIETDIDVDMNTAMNHGKTDRVHGYEHCNLRESTCCSRIKLLLKYKSKVIHM